MKFALFIYIVFHSALQAANAQQPEIIKYRRLHELMNAGNDTTYIINFWATWCRPCVEELPGFIEAEKQSKGKKQKFFFISLDFKSQVQSRLLPFLKDKNMTSTVYLLDEPDYDNWINKVDAEWQGNIPATLIYNHALGKRKFYAKELDREELKAILNEFNVPEKM